LPDDQSRPKDAGSTKSKITLIHWRRSLIPSDGVANAYGLISECAQQHVLGEDTRIDIEACDECYWQRDHA
jgi:hypothetical protein